MRKNATLILNMVAKRRSRKEKTNAGILLHCKHDELKEDTVFLLIHVAKEHVCICLDIIMITRCYFG